MNHLKSSGTLVPADTATSIVPEKLVDILPRTKVHRAIVGKIINCRYCKAMEAQIFLEGRDYMVQCATCGAKYYLREQSLSTEYS